jgi:hypothetical protein
VKRSLNILPDLVPSKKETNEGEKITETTEIFSSVRFNTLCTQPTDSRKKLGSQPWRTDQTVTRFSGAVATLTAPAFTYSKVIM